jgi:type II secretory pathway pseudopilin PulG
MKNQRGSTFIELLLYITIVGVIMVTVSSFMMNLLTSRSKVTASSEVLASARLIQDRLSDAARHAEGMNTGSSTFGTDPGVLSLNMVASGVDPTVFSLTADDGQFQVSEAGGGNVALSTDAVQVTNLVFTNLTSVDDTGIIQVQFTIRALNASGSSLFDYEESFQTTLRIPLD